MTAEAAVVSLQHRTHRPGTAPVHGRTLRREARTVSTALASLTAASLLSGSVVSFAEQRKERALHEGAPVVAVGLVDGAHGGVESEVTALAVEVDALGPGSIDEGCVIVTYGRAPVGPDAWVSAARGATASLRLTGRVDPATPSASSASALIEVGRGGSADCTDFVASHTLYAGDLRRLAVDHGDHTDGLTIMDRARAGGTVTLRFVVSAPPGATPSTVATPFWFDVEARPVGE